MEKDWRFKHGMSDTRLYRIYYHMVQRCTNPNNARYKYYGGRGIKVCKEWLEDKELFFQWSMQNGYADNLTIDREDVNGDYCPQNCRWITNKEQQENKQNTIVCSLFGEEKPSCVVADDNGINKRTVGERAKRGLKDEELIKNPVHRKVLYEGKRYNLHELSELLNINYNTLQSRANANFTDEEMVMPVDKNAGIETYQCDDEGNIINVFKSATEASEVTGISKSGIIMCCLGQRKHCGGYVWKRAKNKSDIKRDKREW